MIEKLSSIRKSFENYVFRLQPKIKTNVFCCGKNYSDKIRILIWILYDLLPRTITSKIQKLDGLKNWDISVLTDKTILDIKGDTFNALDPESLCILSPKYESWMWEYLKNIKQGDVFVDVGAHIGKYTIPIAKRVGKNGLVIAIEADPENFDKLLKNISLNELDNVIPINVAALDRECEVTLYAGPRKGQNSIKKNYGRGYTICNAMRLDKIIENLDVSKVDFMKVDVEGSELDVLKGAMGIIEKFHPRIIVEITFGNCSYLYEFAEAMNYQAKSILPNLKPPYFYLSPKDESNC